jgi:hypothetical protein
VKIRRSRADHWFSRWIRRDWKCVACRQRFQEGSQGLHCAHIWSRRHRGTRWLNENAIPLCFACHQRFGENPLGFHDWLQGWLDPADLLQLAKRANQVTKVTTLEEKLVTEYWQGMVLAYTDDQPTPGVPPEIRHLCWLGE